jgi:hypothetical protein
MNLQSQYDLEIEKDRLGDRLQVEVQWLVQEEVAEDQATA